MIPCKHDFYDSHEILKAFDIKTLPITLCLTSALLVNCNSVISEENKATHTLEKLTISFIKKAPGKKRKTSYTIPNNMVKGLKTRVKAYGLKVTRVKNQSHGRRKKARLFVN